MLAIITRALCPRKAFPVRNHPHPGGASFNNPQGCCGFVALCPYILLALLARLRRISETRFRGQTRLGSRLDPRLPVPQDTGDVFLAIIELTFGHEAP